MDPIVDLRLSELWSILTAGSPDNEKQLSEVQLLEVMVLMVGMSGRIPNLSKVRDAVAKYSEGGVSSRHSFTEKMKQIISSNVNYHDLADLETVLTLTAGYVGTAIRRFLDNNKWIGNINLPPPKKKVTAASLVITATGASNTKKRRPRTVRDTSPVHVISSYANPTEHAIGGHLDNTFCIKMKLNSGGGGSKSRRLSPVRKAKIKKATPPNLHDIEWDEEVREWSPGSVYASPVACKNKSRLKAKREQIRKLYSHQHSATETSIENQNSFKNGTFIPFEDDGLSSSESVSTTINKTLLERKPCPDRWKRRQDKQRGGSVKSLFLLDLLHKSECAISRKSGHGFLKGVCEKRSTASNGALLKKACIDSSDWLPAVEVAERIITINRSKKKKVPSKLRHGILPTVNHDHINKIISPLSTAVSREPPSQLEKLRRKHGNRLPAVPIASIQHQMSALVFSTNHINPETHNTVRESIVSPINQTKRTNSFLKHNNANLVRLPFLTTAATLTV